MVCLTTSSALAGPYEDCILSGMKGVSGDAAANAVKLACRTKVKEAKEAKQDEIGLPLRDTEYEWDNNSLSTEKGGYFSQVLRNNSPVKLVTYFSMEIRDSDYNDYKEKDFYDPEGKSAWQKERTATYFYILSLKPGAQIRLLYPKPKTKEFFSKARSALGREPKWSDSIPKISSGDSTKPLVKDPLE